MLRSNPDKNALPVTTEPQDIVCDIPHDVLRPHRSTCVIDVVIFVRRADSSVTALSLAAPGNLPWVPRPGVTERRRLAGPESTPDDHCHTDVGPPHLTAEPPPTTGVSLSTPTADRYPAGLAVEDLTATRKFTAWFDERTAAMGDVAVGGDSLLPGWTRAHVLTHLARNADGLVNLLTWARTGVEHQMYASDADRDADIAEGANRIAALLHEDLSAANHRFFAAAEALPSTAWEATVAGRAGAEVPAHRIPLLRLSELAVHAVDLDCGLGFRDVVAQLGDRTADLVDRVVGPYRGRNDVPAVRLAVTLPGGQVRTWQLGEGDPTEVAGHAADALGWLTGRANGSALDGDAPALPAWL